jgi:hypothetical protein
MAGMETLAIDDSSTFMNTASESATVPMISLPPVSGGSGCDGGRAGVAGFGELMKAFR